MTQWAAFSKGDIEQRWARARAAMEARELDALLITGEENFQYFTGSTGTFDFALLTAPVQPCLVFPLDRQSPSQWSGRNARRTRSKMCTTYLEDVRGYVPIEVSFPYEMSHRSDW